MTPPSFKPKGPRDVPQILCPTVPPGHTPDVCRQTVGGAIGRALSRCRNKAESEGLVKSMPSLARSKVEWFVSDGPCLFGAANWPGLTSASSCCLLETTSRQCLRIHNARTRTRRRVPGVSLVRDTSRTLRAPKRTQRDNSEVHN